ncbi:MAG: RNA-binding protein [Tannerellaceae bacterium]|nr:RNA-binding protein [Tannerellaceae bacterium]
MNIYISNLSYSITDGDLTDLFNEYGPVTSAKVIMDRETGRSRGFGFVEMEDADGQNAIDELNNAEYEGKTISVSVARPRTERPAGGGGYNRGGGFGGNRGGYNRDNGGYNRGGGNGYNLGGRY